MSRFYLDLRFKQDEQALHELETLLKSAASREMRVSEIRISWPEARKGRRRRSFTTRATRPAAHVYVCRIGHTSSSESSSESSEAPVSFAPRLGTPRSGP